MGLDEVDDEAVSYLVGLLEQQWLTLGHPYSSALVGWRRSSGSAAFRSRRARSFWGEGSRRPGRMTWSRPARQGVAARTWLLDLLVGAAGLAEDADEDALVDETVGDC